MAKIYVDNEINPEPLGDFILDYLHNSLTEWANVDYKLTIDTSRGSDFVKIAKDIFGMANWGGGWILFGYEELPNKTVVPRGLDDRFRVDQAALQEKFNSYSSAAIELPFRVFEKDVLEDNVLSQRLFAAIFIHPSSSILKPKKNGSYIDPHTQRKKVEFRKGDVKTRRGTQTVDANESEIELMKERVTNEQHRLSLLSGEVDRVKEKIIGNLLKVETIPEFVYSGKLIAEYFPFSDIGLKPFIKTGDTVFSFFSLANAPFGPFFHPDSHSKIRTKDLILDSEKSNLVIRLMNLEAVAAMKTRQLTYDWRSRSLFFECEGLERIEAWGIAGLGKPRRVARRFQRAEGTFWRHYSVKLRFEVLGTHLYLRVEPGVILTSNGKQPIFGFQEGLIVAQFLRRRHNRTHYLDLHYWLSLLTRKSADDETISFGDKILVSSDYVFSIMENGISQDRPAREQKMGIGELKGERFDALFVPEPHLVFGEQKEEYDPRLGLKYYGPFHAADEEPIRQLRVGVLATGETMPLAKSILTMIGNRQNSMSHNHFLFPDYPGIHRESSIGCELVTSKTWQETLPNNEISRIIETAKDDSKDDINERIARAVRLYVERIGSISIEDNRPDMILCMIPKELNMYCGISEMTREAKRRKFSRSEKQFAQLRTEGQTTLMEYGMTDPAPKNFDLRNAVKGEIMKFGIPVQFLLEEKAAAVLNYSPPSAVQDPATFSWNLGTAMYYKANGKPWRLAKLTEGTCYIGISFFKNRRDAREGVEASMAQVFTHSGDGFVLRGSDVLIDKMTKEPHLSEEESNRLLIDAIEKYSEKVRTKPSRVVVHKTSTFTSAERKGFIDAIGSAYADLVSIRFEPGIRFVRTGRYPVLRGTLVKLAESKYLLYTSGYIPRLRTYPGHRVPSPLLLTMDCDSEPVEVASEILKLTKINWNTTAFCDKLPITLTFPRQVGKVLSELPEDAVIQSHYRFYM